MSTTFAVKYVNLNLNLWEFLFSSFHYQLNHTTCRHATPEDRQLAHRRRKKAHKDLFISYILAALHKDLRQRRLRMEVGQSPMCEARDVPE
jgi:hypothetical protein